MGDLGVVEVDLTELGVHSGCEGCKVGNWPPLSQVLEPFWGVLWMEDSDCFGEQRAPPVVMLGFQCEVFSQMSKLFKGQRTDDAEWQQKIVARQLFSPSAFALELGLFKGGVYKLVKRGLYLLIATRNRK